MNERALNIFKLNKRIAKLENDCAEIKYNYKFNSDSTLESINEIIKENEEKKYSLMKRKICARKPRSRSRNLYLYRIKFVLVQNDDSFEKPKILKFLQWYKLDNRFDGHIFYHNMNDHFQQINYIIPEESVHEVQFDESMRELHKTLVKECVNKFPLLITDGCFETDFYMIRYRDKCFDIDVLLSHVLHEIMLNPIDKEKICLVDKVYSRKAREIKKLRIKLDNEKRMFVRDKLKEMRRNGYREHRNVCNGEV